MIDHLGQASSNSSRTKTKTSLPEYHRSCGGLIEMRTNSAFEWRCVKCGQLCSVLDTEYRADPITESNLAMQDKTVAEFRKIDHVETNLFSIATEGEHVEADDPGVRLYCTQSPEAHGERARWALQVRAKVKTKSRRGEAKHFAIGTASMSRADLVWLRGLIDQALASKP